MTPGIPAAINATTIDPTSLVAVARGTASLSTWARPARRRGRNCFALHFGLRSGEVRYPGRGLPAASTAATLFARLITPDAGPEQRPLATCSDGRGLALGIAGGTLRLFQAGAGCIDSRIAFPVGSWVACAVARDEVEGTATFFLFDLADRVIRHRVVAMGERAQSGDGVLTLNSRTGGAAFIGAMTALGLVAGAWTETQFRSYLARAFLRAASPGYTGVPGLRRAGSPGS